AQDCVYPISPMDHARSCSIASRGRESEGCTDSKWCRTCCAHAAAQKARSLWSESVSVPPRRMVMKRMSRSFGRITSFSCHFPPLLTCYDRPVPGMPDPSTKLASSLYVWEHVLLAAPRATDRM